VRTRNGLDVSERLRWTLCVVRVRNANGAVHTQRLQLRLLVAGGLLLRSWFKTR
jgi:hypothetical protein